MKAYTDTLKASGMIQYFDAWGCEWRRENKGCGIYHFFRDCGDAFEFQGAVRTSKKGVKKIHEEYINQPDYE